MNRSFPQLSLPDHPNWIALYQQALTICRGNLLVNPYPGWETHLACMPGVPICWVWDSCFMALYSRYFDGELPALGNLDNLYRQQTEEGFIAMAYQMDLNAPAYGTRINPPLFAWAEHASVLQTGDLDRVARVLPHLVRLFEWYQRHRRRPDGLYWFEDSGSTGMDNAPRSGYASEYLNGSDICHVDLISQQAHAAESIALLADLIGEKAIATRFRSERETLLVLIQKHWSPRGQFFYDLFYHREEGARHNFVNHRTIAGFWPMFAGACTREQAEALVKTLFDPEEFYTPHPVATLSRKDPNYHPDGGYWLGGVWAPTNYMVVCALRRYGYHDQAREIAARHLEAMSRVAENPAYGSIWECYAPELDAPGTMKVAGQLSRRDFVGWSGLGPISMLLEDLLGFEGDAPNRLIRWRPREAGSITDLPFAGGKISLHYEEGKRFKVATSQPLSLEIVIANGSSTYTLSAGAHDLGQPAGSVSVRSESL